MLNLNTEDLGVYHNGEVECLGLCQLARLHAQQVCDIGARRSVVIERTGEIQNFSLTARSSSTANSDKGCEALTPVFK